jgi:hypothetical protein
MQSPLAINVSQGRLSEFCHRWKIVALALFGSATRDDFGPESDIDLLATFAPDAEWSLLDHMQMEMELAVLFNVNSGYAKAGTRRESRCKDGFFS